MKLRQIAACAFALVASCFLASRANALMVSPPVVDYEMDPGKSQTGKILISNDSNETYTYIVSTQRFKAGGENGDPDILPENEDNAVNDLKDWITFSGEQTVTLDPGQFREFTYEIQVPQNAEPGGHYAVAFFSHYSNVEGESGVGLGAKLGVLFLVNVSGNTTEGANLESFAMRNTFISHLPAEMSIRIRNTGTNYFRPKGNVTIRNIFGMESAKIPANTNKNAVLPNSIRRLDTWWVKDQYSVKDEGFVSGLKNEWNNFGFGYYTATAYVTYGTKDTRFDPISVHFWVFPWRISLLVVVALIALFMLIKLYNRSIISSAMRKNEKK